MERRLTPFSGRIAHESLRGSCAAKVFTKGESASLIAPLVDLKDAPDGARDRQLLFGDEVLVIDRCQHSAFVQAQKDGYCGWIDSAALGKPQEAGHRIAVRASHLYSAPSVHARELCALPFGAKLCVIETHGETHGESHGAFAQTTAGFVPKVHLCALNKCYDDPVRVAEMFLGAPYLWGGNSAAGLDCSGLIQAALLACGVPCPGDSDMQQQLGAALKDDEINQRGDLLFWRGHVAMVVDAQRLIHANAHSMSVAFEPIDACAARIDAAGGGAITARRRLSSGSAFD